MEAVCESKCIENASEHAVSKVKITCGLYYLLKTHKNVWGSSQCYDRSSVATCIYVMSHQTMQNILSTSIVIYHFPCLLYP